MTFTPKAWADGSGGATPITAAELLRIERAIDRTYGRTPQVLANATTTAETVVASWDIAASELSVNDMLNVRAFGQVAGTGTVIFRLRMGTAGTTADAVLVTFGTSAAGAANQHWSTDLVLAVLSATTATASGHAMLNTGTLTPTAAAFAAATINLTVANKVSLTQQFSAAAANVTRAASLSWTA